MEYVAVIYKPSFTGRKLQADHSGTRVVTVKEFVVSVVSGINRVGHEILKCTDRIGLVGAYVK